METWHFRTWRILLSGLLMQVTLHCQVYGRSNLVGILNVVIGVTYRPRAGLNPWDFCFLAHRTCKETGWTKMGPLRQNLGHGVPLGMCVSGGEWVMVMLTLGDPWITHSTITALLLHLDPAHKYLCGQDLAGESRGGTGRGVWHPSHGTWISFLVLFLHW